MVVEILANKVYNPVLGGDSMKKFLSIFLILALAVCMVACGEKDLPENEEINLLDKVGSGEGASQEIVKYFDEEMIDIYSKTQVIKLPENPETGYEWVYVIDDSEVMSVIKDEYQLSENSGDVTEDVGYRVCEIQGLAEGETIIYFDYISGLETDEEPVESIKFYISVNANNEIAVTDEIH